MKSFFLLLSVVFVQICGYQHQFYFSLISSYFQEYGIKFSVFFNCWNKHEIVTLHQQMSALNVRCSFIKSKKYGNVAIPEKKLVSYNYVLDYSCETFSDILFVDIYKFRLTRSWLILTNYNNTAAQWEFTLANISLRMDSNVKVAVPQKAQNKITLLSVYNPGFRLGGKAVITNLGSWNGHNLEIVNRNLTFYLERRNMSSIMLRSVTVVLRKDYSGTLEEYLLDSRDKQFDSLSKYHYAIFLLMKEVHNFTFSLKKENIWFGNYQNGTDAGIGKYLYEGKGDISSTGVLPRAARLETLDILMLTFRFKTGYIFRNPRSYDPFSNEFLKPFSSMVWYLIVFSTLIICVFLKMLYRIENKFTGSNAKYSWMTVILIALSTVFQQGSSVCPNGHATRLVFISLQLTSIVLFNYYTSSIISALLGVAPHFLHTLDELGHSKLEIAVEDHPYTITYFKIMNYSDVQYIWKNKVFPKGAKYLNTYTAEEGIARVRKGGFAYHTQLNTGYSIIDRTFDQDAICDLNVIPMIQQGLAGMVIPKQSEYKELFQVTMQIMNQAGLVQRLLHIWQSKQPECLSNAKIAAVGADQTFIAFLILITGIAFSLCFLLVEIFWLTFDIDKKLVNLSTRDTG